MPKAGSVRSSKPHAISPAHKAGAIHLRDAWAGAARRSNNDIHQPPGDHADFLRLLSGGELLCRLVRDRGAFDLLAARARRHLQMASQLAVDLNHELDRVL